MQFKCRGEKTGGVLRKIKCFIRKKELFPVSVDTGSLAFKKMKAKITIKKILGRL